MDHQPVTTSSSVTALVGHVLVLLEQVHAAGRPQLGQKLRLIVHIRAAGVAGIGARRRHVVRNADVLGHPPVAGVDRPPALRAARDIVRPMRGHPSRQQEIRGNRIPARPAIAVTPWRTAPAVPTIGGCGSW